MNKSKVLVELQVNGVTVPGKTQTIVHELGSKITFTVSGGAQLLLSENDIVTVKVTPTFVESLSEGIKKYRLVGAGSSAHMQRVRNFA